MGKHSREYQARQQSRRRMRIGSAVAVSGLAVVGSLAYTKAGEEQLSPEIERAKQDYTETYDCRVADQISFKFENFGQDDTVFGSSGLRMAKTDGHTITFHSSLAPKTAANSLIHELGHACVDLEPRMFRRSYDTGTGIDATGAVGFKVWFNDSVPERQNTFNAIDEGVVEYLATGVPNYNPSSDPGYSAVNKVTERLVLKTNLDRQELFEMHQNSDLLGFIADVQDVTVQNVTDQHVTNLIFLYQNAITTGYVPSDEELSINYGIN